MADPIAGAGGQQQQQQQPQCPLLQLPAELRTAIWELALAHNGFLEFEPSNTATSSTTNSCLQPALTLTCHAIRAETLDLFHSTNKFLVNIVSVASEQRVRRWLQHIGTPNRAALRRVYIAPFSWTVFGGRPENFRRGQEVFRTLGPARAEEVDGKEILVLDVDDLVTDRT